MNIHSETISQKTAQNPHLILLHGLFGMGSNLTQLARKLSHDFTVHMVDLPGHGLSDDCDFSDLLDMSEYLLDWMDEKNIQQTHLLGHSLGGKIAMQMANQQPQLFQSLIVADIAPIQYEHSHQTIINALQSIDMSQVNTRSEVDRQLSENIKQKGVRAFLLKNLYQQKSQENEKASWQWHFDLHQLAWRYPQLCEAPRLNKANTEQMSDRVLFVFGGQSSYYNREAQAAITQYYPLARLQFIDDAGHWLHVEKPDEFFGYVTQFLHNITH